MENASKALLIAGSILIVILLIAVGMMVFGGAQSNIEGSIASMSSQEKEAFNNQYLMYNGKQKGSSVKSMINKVIANNSNEGTHVVNINGENEATDLSGLLNEVTSTATYTIEFGYTDGVISDITVKDSAGSTIGAATP